MHQYPKSRSGLTLVELIVVIGIIALLVGILLPVVSKAREAGRIAVCTSNLHQIDTAWKTWAQLPKNSSKAMKLPDVEPEWMTAVTTISQDNRILYCPNGSQSLYVAGTAPTFGGDSGYAYTNKKYGGNGHPVPTWTPADPADNPNLTTYTLWVDYQNVHVGNVQIKFEKVSGNIWKWTALRVDPGGPSGGKPIKVTWGADVWNNIATGDTGTHTLVGGTSASGGSNYGYNIEMAGALCPKSARILAMDYDKLGLDYTNDYASTSYLKTGRHNGKRNFNALFTDSSVQLLTTKEVANSISYYNK